MTLFFVGIAIIAIAVLGLRVEKAIELLEMLCKHAREQAR